MLAFVDQVRSLRGPTRFDIQLNQLSIIRRTWSGEFAREGVVVSEDVLTLPKKYPTRYLTQAQMDGTAGSYTTEDILVDHITPTDGNGAGWTREQLMPTKNSNSEEIIYRLEGSHTGEFGVVELRALRPFTWQLVLRRDLTHPNA